MDEENKELIYQQVLEALHGFGLTDDEIQMRMNYMSQHPEFVEQFKNKKEISPDDIKPYVFPSEPRAVDGENDLGEEPYPADTGASMGEEEDLFTPNNPYDNYEFKDFGWDSFDYDRWKYDTARRVEGGRRNHPEIIDDDVYEEFLVMQNFAKRIEKAVISAYNEVQDNPDNIGAVEELDYYEVLQDMLYKKMIRTAPVEFLSSLTWKKYGSDEVKRYDEKETEDIVYHYNCFKEYDQKCKDIEDEIAEFEAEHPNMDEKTENEYNILLAKQTFFDIKCNEHSSQVPINIDQFRTMKYDTDPEIMTERHSSHIETLLSQAKEVQAKEIELLSSYELGDSKVNPRDEVEDLQEEFKRINGKIDFLKNLGTILGIGKEKSEEEIEQDDGIIKASGKDVLALMNSKQRYTARKNIHAMEKGKAPGWLKRQALRLPIGSTDDLIIAYIDKGKLDIEQILGYSREELGVRAEAKRVAREIREERERAAKRPKTRTESEEDRSEDGSSEAGDSAGEGHEDEEPKTGEHEDGKSEDEEGKGKEPEGGTPEGGEGKGEGEESEGEPTGSDDTSKIIEEIMSKFDSLSSEARVEIYAKCFGLDEQGKEVFALFDSLSQEGKEALWQKMYGDEEKTKDDPIKE